MAVHPLNDPSTATVRATRRVLAVARSVPSADRLLDAVQMFRGDDRVEVTFTVNRGSISGAGVEGLLRDSGVQRVVDWEHAVREREHYHLAIAASPKEGLHRLSLPSGPGTRAPGHGPPLVLMPHGAGHNRLLESDQDTPGTASGLDPRQLTHGGQVVPTRIALTHTEQLARLGASSPDAAERAVVTGDLSFDRMSANLGRRHRYGAALNTGDRQLVVVCSTWNRHSLMGAQRNVIRRLLAELPADEYQVALVAHPNVWYRHGRHQMELWLADEMEAGLRLVAPHEGWRAALIAATVVVGDHGSCTYYAAALGRAVLLAAFGRDELDPSSPLHAFAGRTPELRAGDAMLPQVEEAAGAARPAAADLMIDHQGESPERTRGLLYELLTLDPPARPAGMFPIPDPVSRAVDVTAWRCAADIEPGDEVEPARVRVRRLPGATAHPASGFLVVDKEDTAMERTQMASVWVRSRVTADPRDTGDAEDWIDATLRRRRKSHLAATATPDGGVLVGARDGQRILLSPTGRVPVAAVAAAVHAWARSGGSIADWMSGIRVRTNGDDTLIRGTPPPAEFRGSP